MGDELILTLIKLLNVVFCFFIIAVSFWHNIKRKIHSNLFMTLSFSLLIILIVQTVITPSFDVISVFLSLVIILIILLDYKKLKTTKLLGLGK